jgi:hypothetical protein
MLTKELQPNCKRPNGFYSGWQPLEAHVRGAENRFPLFRDMLLKPDKLL